MNERNIVDEHLMLLRQREAGQLHRLGRVRWAAGLAVYPAALVCAVMLTRYGRPGGADQLIGFVLTMLAGLTLIGGALWWAARTIWPSLARWPRTRRSAVAGMAVTAAVATGCAGLLAGTAPGAALSLWLAVAACAVVGWRLERSLDHRLRELDREIAMRSTHA
jgi:hypothetical protein